MPTTIEVNKQSVEALLGGGKEKPFVIPDFQRPYAWQREQVEILFDDIWDFTSTKGGTKRNETYFLGCVVSYENKKGEQEIIDGQQRITSLFLLLRAIYTKLLATPEIENTPEAVNFISKIEPTIWRTDKLTGKVDYGDTLLTSRVINNDGNEILKNILETGKADEKAKDNYSRNYLHFQKLLEEHSKENPFMVYQFIYALLNQAILLPITADSQDTALTIFSTLNDRGLPLSDADIFKATIYKGLAEEERTKFIECWQDLSEKADGAGESIQQLFYYNMFYLRAKERDTNSTTPGVRKYYCDKENAASERLSDPNLMETLFQMLNLWRVVNKREELENEEWSKNPKILQTLDVLSSYPNEFWKYPVIIYYVCYHTDDNFEVKFELFLNKLLRELLTKYLLEPSVTAVKAAILKLNSKIIESDRPLFDFGEADAELLKSKIKTPNKNVVKMLLKILAYEKQDSRLPINWEIEHIFPRKWQTNYFPETSQSEIEEKIEHIGNKLPIEKKLNIIAGNGYFGKKKDEYRQSKITITKELGESKTTEWNMDSIIIRDDEVYKAIMGKLNSWNDAYLNTPFAPQEEQPSEEQLAQIAEFKKKGWI